MFTEAWKHSPTRVTLNYMKTATTSGMVIGLKSISGFEPKGPRVFVFGLLLVFQAFDENS